MGVTAECNPPDVDYPVVEELVVDLVSAYEAFNIMLLLLSFWT